MPDSGDKTLAHWRVYQENRQGTLLGYLATWQPPLGRSDSGQYTGSPSGNLEKTRISVGTISAVAGVVVLCRRSLWYSPE